MKKFPHIIPLLSLVILFLLLVGAYAWGTIKINALEQTSDTLQSDIQTKTAQIQTANSIDLQQKNEDETNALSKLNSFFIIQGQEFTLIQEVESLCQDAGVTCTIQPVGIDPAAGLPANFQSLHIIINAGGTFNSLYHLTQILENLPYRVTISQVSLESNGDTNTKDRQWKEIFDFNVTTTTQ